VFVEKSVCIGQEEYKGTWWWCLVEPRKISARPVAISEPLFAVETENLERDMLKL